MAHSTSLLNISHSFYSSLSEMNMFVTSDVMLITGGSSSFQSSVEIFDPSNPSLTCSLPDMTVTRYEHAAAGMTVCGGYDS